MKFWVLIISLHFSLVLSGLYAQTGIIQEQMAPLNSNVSPVFGTDIIIDDEPLQNQRTVSICSAFNGWLFAAKAYNLSTGPWLSFLKSTDNGKNWELLSNDLVGFPGNDILKVVITAGGTDTTNMKLFVGGLMLNSVSGYSHIWISRYNYNTHEWEDEILHESSRWVKDIALASDLMYPASNASPHSIAVVYSKNSDDWPFQDTLIYCSSSNGGQSFDFRVGVMGTVKYFNKVAIAYGRSASYTQGNYFIAWEEKQDANSPFGHIYCAHPVSNFQSSFTTPYLLDEDPSINDKVRNPAISCQFNASDNSFANLTEIVLCEKYVPALNLYDIIGFVNKSATTSNTYQSFDFTTTQGNNLQPDICFNPFDSTFNLTYFDSAEMKLPYLKNDFNLSSPDSWSILSDGYNDSGNLDAPYPKIRLAQGQQSIATCWIAQGNNDNGMAMFDSPFNFPVGIPKTDKSDYLLNVRIYPNPIDAKAIVEINLSKPEYVTMESFNLIGQSLGTLFNGKLSQGVNKLMFDFGKYNQGIYFIQIRTQTVSGTESISIQH